MYECHITLPLSAREIGCKVAEEFHWSTSEIERDPVLGKASYFYLTSHDKDQVRLFKRMEQAADACINLGAEVVRKKIEHIIYDTKMKV
jgi:hypothetical protein